MLNLLEWQCVIAIPGHWLYCPLQVKKHDYNITPTLQRWRPALQLDCNPGDAVTTGGNARSALQLSGCSGDVILHTLQDGLGTSAQ